LCSRTWRTVSGVSRLENVIGSNAWQETSVAPPGIIAHAPNVMTNGTASGASLINSIDRSPQVAGDRPALAKLDKLATFEPVDAGQKELQAGDE